MGRNSKKTTVSKGNGVASGVSKKSKSKNKKFKNTRLFKILRVLLILVIIIFIINIISDIVHKNSNKISLVIGDKKITLTHDISMDKYNNIYMSIEDVKKIYDKNIYFSNDILITTYNMHIAVLETGKNTMKVNDVVQEIKGSLKKINGIVYLPFSDMKDVYDFSEKYNKDTKVLSVDSKLVEKKEAVVLKNSKLKETTKNFAKTLENVKKSQYVTIFETEGAFTKVRTKSGNIGYIKTKKLSEPEIRWENMDEDELKSVTVLSDYTIVDSNYEVLQNAKKDSITIPNLFSIVKSDDEKVDVKSIIDLNGKKFETYKNWAEESNVTICPTVTLDCNMSDVCSSYETRSYIINTLFNELVNNKLTMICVDFTSIDDNEGLYRFVTEMVPRFKCSGMKVLVKYNSSLNKDRLNNIVDFVIE